MSTFDRSFPCLLGVLILASFRLLGQSNDILDDIADRYQLAYKVPGLAIAVVQPDTFYIGLGGNRQSGKDMPIEVNDLFHIGSNTKAFTAFLAAHLVEQGIANWSDKLLEVVPELDQPKYQAYRTVTLEQLLSHRAGIAPFESASSKEFRAIPKDIQTHDNPRLTFARVALSFAPRTPEKKNHLYSNGGYILAALMLERLTHSTYEEL
ncbi:MAG: beta-lactamase family protein, partial [Saprospiraceae bacterium]|nr:beta-lactamase family protein [Saprospiraceae bacterium]